jgi:hypothetical protein
LAHALRQIILKPHCAQSLLGKLILLPLNVACLFTNLKTAFVKCGSINTHSLNNFVIPESIVHDYSLIFIESAYNYTLKFQNVMV